MEFVNNLVSELQQFNNEMYPQGIGEEEAPITEKDFMLAFARCLCGTVHEAEMEEMLELRADEYRKIGKLFGMEKVQQHFSWNKFGLTFFSDTFAFISFPLCKILDYLRSEEDDERSSFYDILTESQWLPSPYASYDAFQHYLMGLWGPSMFSIISYCVFFSYMEHVSLMEVLSPIIIYFIIGTYIATISGYEHPKLVLRRLNMHLSSEVRQNELHAVFAFRAHTPEGHAVNQIATIADVLFKNKFQWWTQMAGALAGILHALTPVFHRMMQPDKYVPGVCHVTDNNSVEVCTESFWKKVFWLAAGGNSMVRYRNTLIHIHIHVHTYVHLHADADVCIVCMWLCVHVHVCFHMYVHMYCCSDLSL